jgi:nucleotide-binding universal stress UspA family protein
MGKILLATDFSETAAQAAETAAQIARRAGDTLVLLHVAEPPTTSIMEIAADARSFEAAMRERARGELRALAARLQARGVAVDERLEAGDAAEVIASTAAQIDARLIVLGSHGRRALSRLLLGSVAQGTLLLADRPLLVARRGSAPEGFAAWAAGERPLSVVFALDRSPGSAAAVACLRDLRKLGPVDVRFVHVFDSLLEAFRRGLDTTAARPDVAAALVEELRDFVGALPGEGAVSFDLRDYAGRPAELVASEEETAHADLLVVGTHQRTRVRRIWLGSTAELALRAASIPVLCVPAVRSAGAQATA